MKEYNITLPLTEEIIRELRAGDRVLLNGIMYTGRDDAHMRLIEMLREGTELPVDLRGECIYYAGPCPAKPGHAIGSAGPTTSGRMDSMTPALLDLGLKGMIGKGQRSTEVVDSMKKNCCVYFAAAGGTGALLSHCIKKADVEAFPELGPEAIYKLEVEDFPVVVAVDCCGGDIYKDGVKNFGRE